ncbi:unnamed protein product [Periconia digitata]|uniref:Uncharacterized protein n=1 Tax=Periconia digitata TaxID=1303443 RepID=A0A9W4UB91_9PLEO|nr:unnamed protein product [Periconia digitata]
MCQVSPHRYHKTRFPCRFREEADRRDTRMLSIWYGNTLGVDNSAVIGDVSFLVWGYHHDLSIEKDAAAWR